MKARKAMGIGAGAALWVLIALTAIALGEGTAELGLSHDLSASTVLYVDILDAATETIQWLGSGSIEIYSEGDVLQGTLASGESLSPGAGEGVYRLVLSENQTEAWDVTVGGALNGRVHSYEWDLLSYLYDDEINGSFFTLVDTDQGDAYDLVVETKLDGYAGTNTLVLANATGLGGTLPDQSFWSAPDTMGTADPEYPIYLNPPEKANYAYETPVLSGTGLDATTILPGSTTITVDFESNVSGHVLLLVDLDQDYQMDRNIEVVALESVSPGANQVVWDGMDPNGDPVPVGAYDLQLHLLVGMHNFLSVEMETSYEGFRQFLVDEAGGRTPLTMFWNDFAVFLNQVQLPGGMYAPPTPGPSGLNSGPYSQGIMPTVNARSWGDFSPVTRGNEAILNTFTFVEEDVGPLGLVAVGEGSIWYEDYDGDGFGNPDVYVTATNQPVGYVADNTDCDDFDFTVYPGAPEICGDGHDNDCDGQTDEDCTPYEILSVSDVGNDQGRQVRLTWRRAFEDMAGHVPPVTDYSVYRRVDQFKSGEPWDFLASVPAHGLDEYNTVVSTLCDSTDAGICWSVFFVRARTTDPLVYFDTPPDSGWSVDNLAPSPPQNPLMAGSILQWDPFVDPDARYATVYGSSTGLADGSEVFLGYSTVTEFDVSGMAHDYYLVSVTDFSGNEGEAAVITNTVSATDDVPRRTILVGNLPNPFNPSTVIVFDLAVGMSVDLRIYDVAGRLVRTLESGVNHAAGRNDTHWDGRDETGQAVSAGVYFCRMVAGDYTATLRMALVK